jgi:hypothetical protein
MKKMVKIVGFIALLAGMSGNIYSSDLKNDIKDIAYTFIKKAKKLGDENFVRTCALANFWNNKQHIEDGLFIAKLKKLGIFVAGSMTSIIAAVFLYKTIKRFLTSNQEENRLWQACKTMMNTVALVGFSAATLASLFGYTAAGQLVTNLERPEVNLKRLGKQELWANLQKLFL